MRVKVAVLVSGGGTNLQALLDANLRHGEIAFVLSNRKAAYALERARARGVETAVLSNVMEPDPVRRDEKPKAPGIPLDPAIMQAHLFRQGQLALPGQHDPAGGQQPLNGRRPLIGVLQGLQQGLRCSWIAAPPEGLQ